MQVDNAVIHASETIGVDASPPIGLQEAHAIKAEIPGANREFDFKPRNLISFAQKKAKPPQ
jgi:hypothetical protein